VPRGGKVVRRHGVCTYGIFRFVADTHEILDWKGRMWNEKRIESGWFEDADTYEDITNCIYELRSPPKGPGVVTPL
jgi:hypothetical protein